MLQPVPVLFQRFRIVPGNSLRQERQGGASSSLPERGSSNHRTKILKANSRRSPCAGNRWGELNDGSTHCQPPLLRAREAEPSCGYVGDRAVRIHGMARSRSAQSCPPSHETSPTTVCAACSSASRMTFLSNRLVHRAKQPFARDSAQGAGPPAIEPLRAALPASEAQNPGRGPGGEPPKGVRYLPSSWTEVMPRTDVMPCARP